MEKSIVPVASILVGLDPRHPAATPRWPASTAWAISSAVVYQRVVRWTSALTTLPSSPGLPVHFLRGACCHTCSLYLTYRQYECQTAKGRADRGDPPGAARCRS